MAVRSTPSSWASTPTIRINGTDFPKLFYDPVMTLETYNEWRKAVTIALSGDDGCHAVLEGRLTYATLSTKYAALKAASTARLDDYQVGHTDFHKDDFALKQYYGRKTRHHKALNRIFQTLYGAVDKQYAKALQAIRTPMSHYNAGFAALLKKCNLSAKHGDVVSQVSIYSMKQMGTFPEFSDKLNLAVFEINERSGGAKDTQVKAYLASLAT